MQNVFIIWTDKSKYEVYDILWKNKTDYAACLKNVVNFLFACKYKINF